MLKHSFICIKRQNKKIVLNKIFYFILFILQYKFVSYLAISTLIIQKYTNVLKFEIW